jgi:hypothetical protein
MPKIAQAQLPKMKRGTRVTIDPSIVKEAVTDVKESYDFAPHAYTDGKSYKTYNEATSAVTSIRRAVAQELGQEPNMFRQRVWEDGGESDRTKDGKWQFALTRRTSPPKPRQSKENGQG